MALPDHFAEELYEIVRQIPAGQVITYGQIARLMCLPGYARHVGHALAQAPAGKGIPCHRVVSGQGRTAPGWLQQRTLLEAEGVRFRQNGCIDLRHCGWREEA